MFNNILQGNDQSETELYVHLGMSVWTGVVRTEEDQFSLVSELFVQILNRAEILGQFETADSIKIVTSENAPQARTELLAPLVNPDGAPIIRTLSSVPLENDIAVSVERATLSLESEGFTFGRLGFTVFN